MTVHVFGPPEGTMPEDSSFCTEKRRTEVVFHEQSIKLSNGYWSCTLCSITSEPESPCGDCCDDH